MSEIKEYITEAAVSVMRNAISDADGREVFFIGHTDENSMVTEVDVIARGTRGAVAAVTRQAEYGDVAIHNHPGSELDPSEADVTIAAQVAWTGVASYIVNNEVTDIYVLVEPVRPEQLVPIDKGVLTALMGMDGALARSLPNFEERAAQQLMIAEVVDAFNFDKISLIEAGTGTGKTLAYLVPAVAWALANKERVVVSTHTINLQEQIIHKDLPIVRLLFDEEFKAVLVKGRQNYVCLRKLTTIEEEPDFFEDEDARELHQLMDWAYATKRGDRAELNFYPRQRVWEKIQSSGETCFHSRCPHSRECFVGMARREASSAQILVTNHALLFSDIAMRAESGIYSDTTVLPRYRRIIFDEAHNIEEVATAHFGNSISRWFYLRTLNLLYRAHQQKETGSLPLLATLLLRNSSKIDPEIDQEELYNKLDQVSRTKLSALFYSVNDNFEEIARLLRSIKTDESGAIQYRLTPERRETEVWKRIQERLLALMKETRSFVEAAREITKEVSQIPLEDEKLSGALVDVEAHISRLKAFADVIDAICSEPGDDFVSWLEASVEDTFVRVSASRAPLDISAAMITHVYEQFPTVIMTSATLTSRKKFDFIETRIGLRQYKEACAGQNREKGQARAVSELLLPTPFDYHRQAIVAIPNNIDTTFIKATRPSADGEHTLRDAIVALLRITKGSAFVLFTSYGLMRKMAREVEGELAGMQMQLMLQGTENRDALLQRFRNATHAVLFGTDSFWAGVDVAGDALQSVIITKLPFRVPTEPIIEARTEYIEAHGGNAFLEYTVPLAVIKFRQGFGRLIRTKSDYGMVAILDRRVIEKYYGKWFLESLPECTLLAGGVEEVIEQANQFFQDRKTP